MSDRHDPSDFPEIEDESDERLWQLIDALKDDDAGIRGAAAWALGKGACGVAPAINALAEALGDPNTEVRKSAAAALGVRRGRRTAGRGAR